MNGTVDYVGDRAGGIDATVELNGRGGTRNKTRIGKV